LADRSRPPAIPQSADVAQVPGDKGEAKEVEEGILVVLGATDEYRKIRIYPDSGMLPGTTSPSATGLSEH
jgi:hypothetical protein